MTIDLVMSQPLCDELHRRLERLFGHVGFANRGEAFHGGFYQVNGRWELRQLHAGEYYCVNCPFCRDTRKRLWVNHMYGQFEPYPSNRRLTHLAICYNEDCLSNHENRMRLADSIFGFFNVNNRAFSMNVDEGERVEVRRLTEAPAAGICQPFSTLPEWHAAVRYFCGERGYSRELLQQKQVLYCLQAAERFQLATHRLVIPVMMDGVCVGWQARYVGDDWDAAGVPKYYGLPGMPKKQMLYNYDEALRWPYVVVVEGMTDVWQVGGCAVAVMGKGLSYPQRHRLLNGWAGKPIILMFDGGQEERDIMHRIVVDLASIPALRSPVFQVCLPDGQDPGGLSPEQIWGWIYARAAEVGVPLQ